jgi:micrococcal nuclease
VNRAQVERGMAWVYLKYNKDASLPGVQGQAREVRRGLWTDAEPIAPRDFPAH